MNPTNDAFWDELGVTWGAIDPDIAVITPRLAARLRRQSIWITAGFVSGTILTAATLGLALLTLWAAWQSSSWHFVVRGLGVSVVCGFLACSTRALHAVQSPDQGLPLSEMLDLVIHRAEQMVLLCRLGLWVCGVISLCGLAGAAVRTVLSAPPRMSPILDLILLGLFAVFLHRSGRHWKGSLARYERLKQSLLSDEGAA